MQKDFHFDVIYCLCRCAGFTPAESRSVAAAAQFTDECTFMGPLCKPNGTPYIAIQTYPGGLSVLDRAVQESVLRPFHFMAAEAEGNVVLACNPAVSYVAKKAAVLATSAASYDLHALGISLHSLSDTFAHQGFSAFWSPLNAVKNLKLIPHDAELLKSILGFFLSKFPDFPLHLGHAQAGYCPDVPFLKWTYDLAGESAWTKQENAGIQFKKATVIRDNAAIASAAVGAAAEALAGLSGLKPPRDVGEVGSFFSPALFRRMNSLKGRSEQWNKLFFGDKFFDFRRPEDRNCFSYDGKEWLGKAIRPSAQPSATMVRVLRKGHTNTAWWKFQLAAKWCGRQLGVKS